MSGYVCEDRLYKRLDMCLRTGFTNESVCGWRQAVQVSRSGDGDN